MHCCIDALFAGGRFVEGESEWLQRDVLAEGIQEGELGARG